MSEAKFNNALDSLNDAISNSDEEGVGKSLNDAILSTGVQNTLNHSELFESIRALRAPEPISKDMMKSITQVVISSAFPSKPELYKESLQNMLKDFGIKNKQAKAYVKLASALAPETPKPGESVKEAQKRLVETTRWLMDVIKLDKDKALFTKEKNEINKTSAFISDKQEPLQESLNKLIQGVSTEKEKAIKEALYAHYNAEDYNEQYFQNSFDIPENKQMPNSSIQKRYITQSVHMQSFTDSLENESLQQHFDKVSERPSSNPRSALKIEGRYTASDTQTSTDGFIPPVAPVAPKSPNRRNLSELLEESSTDPEPLVAQHKPAKPQTPLEEAMVGFTEELSKKEQALGIVVEAHIDNIYNASKTKLDVANSKQFISEGLTERMCFEGKEGADIPKENKFSLNLISYNEQQSALALQGKDKTYNLLPAIESEFKKENKGLLAKIGKTLKSAVNTVTRPRSKEKNVLSKGTKDFGR